MTSPHRVPTSEISRRAGRVAATLAMVGVSVYVVLDVILQLLPPHYSPISQAESDLAVGPFGWIMAINFFGRGLTSSALLVAIATSRPQTGRRDLGIVLFAIAGFCSALIAFFPTDIARAGAGRAVSVHGVIHLAGASTGFLLALAAVWVLSRRREPGTTVFLVVASAGFVFLVAAIVRFPAVFGLAERLFLAGILGWVFAAALSARGDLSPRRTG